MNKTDTNNFLMLHNFTRIDMGITGLDVVAESGGEGTPMLLFKLLEFMHLTAQLDKKKTT